MAGSRYRRKRKSSFGGISTQTEARKWSSRSVVWIKQPIRHAALSQFRLIWMQVRWETVPAAVPEADYAADLFILICFRAPACLKQCGLLAPMLTLYRAVTSGLSSAGLDMNPFEKRTPESPWESLKWHLFFKEVTVSFLDNVRSRIRNNQLGGRGVFSCTPK